MDQSPKLLEKLPMQDVTLGSLGPVLAAMGSI